MKVLIACERSGIVRDAFRRAGHLALSCDMVETDYPGPHYKGDVRDVLTHPWDLLIAHPPCTYLCNVGFQHLQRENATNRWQAFQRAIEFFQLFQNADVPRICIENPIMHGHAKELVGDYTQKIQPYQFGNMASKATCLWLKNLPPLVPTHVVPKGEIIERGNAKWYSDAFFLPAEERARIRSETFLGIADAMASQWGNLSITSTT